MTERKLNKSQRRAMAKVLYWHFHQLVSLSSLARLDQWFLESMTDEERKELENLKTKTHNLSNKWRSLAWKLDGYDEIAGPPRRSKR